MADPELHYAQAWAFVHYLRHGDLARESLIGAYLAVLAETGDRDQAFERAFGARDLEALNESFRAYVASLH